jgi:hypothetical protein
VLRRILQRMSQERRGSNSIIDWPVADWLRAVKKEDIENRRIIYYPNDKNPLAEEEAIKEDCRGSG